MGPLLEDDACVYLEDDKRGAENWLEVTRTPQWD